MTRYLKLKLTLTEIRDSVMSKRRWNDILKELWSETHRDGYYCRRPSLENIVDELVEELKYANLLSDEFQPTPTKQDKNNVNPTN